MQSYLGVDAGGSGSRWALVDPQGEVMAEGADGPSIQVAECGIEEAAARVCSVLEAVAAAHSLGAEPPVVVGLAGITAGEGRAGLAAELAVRAPGRRICLAEDTVTGAAAALADGPGVAVFAGTGSFAIARSTAGPLFRVGGRGSIASDLGSGYRLVVSAASIALRAHDGMAPATMLGARLAGAFEVGHLDDLGLALKQATTRAIAAAAPSVLACAAAGDPAARDVVRSAARDLAELAVGAAERAGLRPRDVPVTGGGGTMASPVYFRAVSEACQAVGFGDLRKMPRNPSVGAAALARAAELGAQPLAGWIDG